jgi:exosortase
MPLGNSAEAITFPLRILVTKLSVFIANNILGIEVIRDGSRIFDPAMKFQFDVAPACSGIRSLITLLALTTIYGFVTFSKNWKRVTVALLAIPLAVLGNTVRITTVIVVGEAFGQEAGAAIEQKLGFITFAVALVAIFVIGYFFGEDKPGGGSPTKPGDSGTPLGEATQPSSSPAV